MTQIATHTSVPLADLVPYEKNARVHSEAQIQQIVAAIEEFGYTNPILIDRNNNLIAGHGRLEAARRIGMTEIPAMVVDGLTPAKRRKLILADNRIAENSTWDEDLLKAELLELQEMGEDITDIGFSSDDLDDFFPENRAGKTDDDAIPDVPVSPATVASDVWLLGEHRVMCGNSTDTPTVQALMAGELADEFLSDPPYNVNYEGKTKNALKIQNDQMGDTAFREFLRLAFAAANAVMKPGAVFYIWHADSEGYNFRGACQDVGWKVRQCLIWVKDTMVMGRQDYHWKHEPCLYGWKDGAAHFWATDRKQVTTIECKRPTRNAVHPTMNPVELMEYQIANNTEKDAIVLDLFGGSGSTLIACEKLGRAARLMELDPKYVDVIVTRWQEFTGQEATLQATGQTFDEVKAERASAGNLQA